MAALLVSPYGFAQVDTSEWQCQYCPFPEGYTADVTAGAEYTSDDALRFGNFSGYDEAGVNGVLDGEGHYAGDDHQLNWYAEDLGLDSRILGIEFGRQGSYGLYLDYRELPYRQFGTTSTVFAAPSANALTLPGNWVRASSTSGLTALAGSLQPIDIASDRSTLSAGADVGVSSGFDLFVDYRHQERDGIDIVSGAGFIRSSLLPRTIDFETDTVDLGIRYSKGPLNLTLGWYGSFFTNNVKSLTWDDPFVSFPGADQGRLAQEPDNEFQQLSLTGAYRADALRSVIAFSAAAGTGEQNEPLLPYTINPTLLPGTLPTAAIDGKVETANYALTLTSNPLPKARFKIAYRFD
ncbi:MAG: MtrB/PioB family outer membrane beta-barrel protein, partial [Gammaproteobacteria bacterium]|nr:MtrB/PioB family outer membrane beta-barrel protein [Gammaproteobacteria bacterium]